MSLAHGCTFPLKCRDDAKALTNSLAAPVPANKQVTTRSNTETLRATALGNRPLPTYYGGLRNVAANPH